MSNGQARKKRIYHYMEPTIEALHRLGGSARPAEVVDTVAEIMHVSADARAEQDEGSGMPFDKFVAWARFYLAKAGFMDSSRRGVWALTDKGRAALPLTLQSAQAVYKEINKRSAARRRQSKATDASDAELEEERVESELSAPTELGSHHDQVLGILKSLSPKGFERFCQRLLREAGFQEVQVTGKVGDEGIDGVGMLQINPLVSFKVLFQCKRYKGSVSAPHVRDFRGTVAGRADKGIIITTGSFTADARREAVRDGVTAIELVDGEKLVEMLENLELGLSPVQAFAVIPAFFADFDEQV